MNDALLVSLCSNALRGNVDRSTPQKMEAAILAALEMEVFR
ncbi:MAG TPA: hypothetical protein VJY99_11005 [Buttiauxella sp.]|nr:hypothetical protein [Buttiauxella sp.]HKM97207.1 hypothetical protein [Buttiauxella sp.]